MNERGLELGRWDHAQLAVQAATVSVVVTDGCGEWPTFFGGGPNAF